VLEGIVNSLATNVDNIWHKHSRKVNITKHSKAWWDDNCQKNLDKYKQSKQLEDWKKFKGMVKKMKCNFFDEKLMRLLTRSTVHGSS